MDKVGRPLTPVGRQHLVEPDHVDEGLRVLSLSDGEIQRDRCSPAAGAVQPVVVLGAGREIGPHLAREVHPGGRAEAPGVRVLEERGEAEL